jgi:hypothetical protein
MRSTDALVRRALQRHKRTMASRFAERISEPEARGSRRLRAPEFSKAIAAALALSFALGGCKQKPTRKIPAPTPVAGASESAPSGASQIPDPHFIKPPVVTSLAPELLLPSRPACWIKIKGGATRKIAGTFVPSQPGQPNTDVSASSDYWSSADDLRAEIGKSAAVFATEAEAQKKLEAQMAADPRLMILRLSCLTTDGGVILMTPGLAKYADVPFKPGTYAISAGDFASARPQEFVAQTVRSGQFDYFHTLKGKLILSKFDASGVSGSFSLSAHSVDGDAQIEVEGKFDLPCDPLGASKCESLKTTPGKGQPHGQEPGASVHVP